MTREEANERNLIFGLENILDNLTDRARENSEEDLREECNELAEYSIVMFSEPPTKNLGRYSETGIFAKFPSGKEVRLYGISNDGYTMVCGIDIRLDDPSITMNPYDLARHLLLGNDIEEAHMLFVNNPGVVSSLLGDKHDLMVLKRIYEKAASTYAKKEDVSQSS